MKQENLIELQELIYKQNCELGWHDEPRSFAKYVCLFHSELSEAMEGDRKNLPDDHLPEYEMFWVELADYVIRCFDWLSSIGVHDAGNQVTPQFFGLTDRCDLMAELHSLTSQAYDKHNTKGLEECFVASVIVKSVELAIGFADMNDDIDIREIILKKVAYNKTRADHKRENRDKEGGKKY